MRKIKNSFKTKSLRLPIKILLLLSISMTPALLIPFWGEVKNKIPSHYFRCKKLHFAEASISQCRERIPKEKKEPQEAPQLERTKFVILGMAMNSLLWATVWATNKLFFNHEEPI